MYLLNDNNEKIIDIYDVKLDDTSFNRKKFKEIISLSNMKLDKQFVYKNQFNNYVSYGKGPLYYPISTLLLAKYLFTELADLVDKDMYEYIFRTLNFYDPNDLYSIDYLIKDDSFFDEEHSTTILEEHLNSIDKDIKIYREIFRHMSFEYSGCLDVSNLKKLIYANQKAKIASYVYNMYVINNDAKRNTKVLQLLNLKPNIKN